MCNSLYKCIISIPNAIIYGESSVTKSAQGYNLTGVECFIAVEYAEGTFAVSIHYLRVGTRSSLYIHMS